jgi:hypothetical protein
MFYLIMPKSKLNKELIKKMTKLLRAGNYRRTVCKAVGISEAGLYNWLKKAQLDIKKGKNTIEVELLKAVEKAEAMAEVDDVSYIKKDKDWKARGWRLSRKHPDRWGDRQKMDVVTEVIITKDTDLADVPEEDLLKALQERQKEDKSS